MVYLPKQPGSAPTFMLEPCLSVAEAEENLEEKVIAHSPVIFQG